MDLKDFLSKNKKQHEDKHCFSYYKFSKLLDNEKIQLREHIASDYKNMQELFEDNELLLYSDFYWDDCFKDNNYSSGLELLSEVCRQEYGLDISIEYAYTQLIEDDEEQLKASIQCSSDEQVRYVKFIFDEFKIPYEANGMEVIAEEWYEENDLLIISLCINGKYSNICIDWSQGGMEIDNEVINALIEIDKKRKFSDYAEEKSCLAYKLLEMITDTREVVF